MSVSSISRGLDQRRAESDSIGLPKSDRPLSSFAAEDLPRSIPDLQQAAHNLQALYDKHEAACADTEALIENNSKDIRKRFDAMSSMSKSDRKKYADSEISDMRKRVLASTDEQRTNLVKEIMGWEQRISRVAPLFDSPAAILSSTGTGTPEYSRYRDDLAAAGPAELLTHARTAILTKNPLLARAVVARVDALPKDVRGSLKFGRQELADAAVGDKYRIAQDAVLRAKRLSDVAVSRFRGMNSGKAMNPMNNISAALAKRRETGASEIQEE